MRRGLMPRYFFNMGDALGRTTDHAGSYFRIEEDAREGALEAAKQGVAGRRMNWSGGLGRGGYIEVVDDQGCVVFTVPLSKAAQAGRDAQSACGCGATSTPRLASTYAVILSCRTWPAHGTQCGFRDESDQLLSKSGFFVF